MVVIEKKVWKEYFEKIISGEKKYELRLGDFLVNKGDVLLLKEWDKQKKEYTGHEISKTVSSVNKFDINNLFWPKEDIEKYGIQIISFE